MKRNIFVLIISLCEIFVLRVICDRLWLSHGGLNFLMTKILNRNETLYVQTNMSKEMTRFVV